jgi:hypothetical protein
MEREDKIEEIVIKSICGRIEGDTVIGIKSLVEDLQGYFQQELDKAREEGYRGGLEEAQTLLEEEFDYWEEKEILYKLDGLDEAIVTISNELDKLKDNK